MSHCMNRLSVLTVILAGLVVTGCGSRPDRSAELARAKALYVTPSISGHLSDATHRLEGPLQAAVARALSARGYTVSSESGADGMVRVAWILSHDVAVTGEDERVISLSLSIFSRSGERLYSARSVQNWPERMWSEDRVASEVAAMLAGIPEAKSSLVPVEGKPSLAPIRLK